MGNFIDLTGQKFGKLTVLKLHHRTEIFRKDRNTKEYKYYWLCKCECGNEKIINGHSLKSSLTKSCGCYKKEIKTTHGYRYHRLYPIWRNMKRRCYNINDKSYKNYGGRGIKVCDEWKNNFQAFYDWAMANGYDENAKKYECTIDRIDVNGNYEPNNCRFVDNKAQANNRRKNIYITYNNETHTLSEWADKLNISYQKLFRRLKYDNWTIERAFTTLIENSKPQKT